MKWNEVKWNEMKRNERTEQKNGMKGKETKRHDAWQETIRSEMKWFETKLNEMKWAEK